MLLLVIALQLPPVQNYAARQAASYLSNTLNTRVEIGGLSTDWRNSVVLKEVYVEDQQQDTLWYSRRLGADIKLWGLLKGNVDVSKLNLEHATVKLHIRPDSSSNFDFLLAAFAADTTAAQPADTTAMKFNLGVITLEDVYVNFRDEAGGNFIRGRVGELVTTMDELDLEAEKYLVDRVELRNTWVDYVQTKLPPEEEPQPLTMQFGLNKAKLQNIKFSFVSRPANQTIRLNLGESELDVDKIDLPNARVDLASFDLHRTSLAYSQDKYKPADSLAVNPAETVKKLDESVEKTKGQPVDWVVTLGRINLTEVEAAIDNFNAPKQPRGMDFDHLLFRDVSLQANDLYYSQRRMAASLEQLRLREKSGFRIEDFQAAITIDSTRARLADLNLKTGYSHIVKEAGARYPSLAAVAENPEQLSLAIDLDRSYIGMQDVLYFAPELADNPSFRKIANTTINVAGEAEGPLNDLRLRQLQASGLQGTAVNVTGRIRNITEPDKLYLDLNIHRFATTRTDVLALAPPGTLPPEVQVPPTLSLTGNYKGSLTVFDADLSLRSSYGNLVANIDMDAGRKGAEPFRADIRTDNLDLGQLLTEDYGLGKVTLQARATGNGITPETMVAQVRADVQKLEYNGYAYSNLGVTAGIDRNVYDVKVESKDQNLAFHVDGRINLRDSRNPVYNLNLNLQGANLQALNLFPEDLRVQGQLRTNLTGADLRTLAGTVEARDLVVVHQNQVYPVDSLLLTIAQSERGLELNVQSDMIAGSFSSKNDLAELPTALQKHFSNYFDLQPDPPFPANLNLQDFAFDFQLKKTGLLVSFVPGLELLEAGDTLRGTYNGENQDLKINTTFRRIVYTGYDLKGVQLNVDGDRNKIGYNIQVREFSDPSLLVRNLTLTGEAHDNEITTRLAVTEDNGRERLVLGGLLNSVGRGYRFSINPDQLVINGDKWTVPQDNYLQFDANLLYANNLRLERNGSYVSFNSTGPVVPNAPLQVQFKDFDLGYVMQTIQREDSLIAGIVNGEATLREIMSGNPAFTSDLVVDNFAYLGNPIGDVAIKAATIGPGRYSLDVALTDNGNNARLTGTYQQQGNTSLLNLDADLTTLNIQALEGFMQGALRNMEGTASGRLRISGTLDAPDVRGQLAFSNAAFTVSMLGSRYRLDNDQLQFTEDGIRLNNITVTDTLNNVAYVSGAIYTDNYVDYRYDLQLRTDRFLAMSSTVNDNPLYYGTLFVSANGTMKGSMNEPVIEGQAQALEGSAITYVVPAATASAAQRAGIVEFVNVGDSLSGILKEGLDDAMRQQSGFKGVDMTANVTITDATPFTIVIDPVSGDHLEVRGNGTMQTGMRPTGEIDLSGRYVVSEGVYKLSFYNLVTREFHIRRGSSIVWHGDPMDATIDMTAVYRTKAAPLELVATEVGGLEQAEQNRFRTQLPFEVHIDLDGDMFQPQIDFDIQLPESDRAAFNGQVEAKLMQLRQDEAEQNKQVFALIVLGRFLAPDPLESSGGGLSATARNSVSQVLSDQLNRLTDQYAGGLGLELGVSSYEDYSSGAEEGRTDLNVALRQQLFNDRMIVRVGTDVGLEGQRREQNNMSNFGGDVSIEYLLTADGRLRVRAFRRNQYEGFLEGEVQETGASLIFQRDYNNFSDLFRSLEARQRRRQQRLQESRFL